MINKRLKDALFSDQWSELCMDTLSPSGYVLVSRVTHMLYFNPTFTTIHHCATSVASFSFRWHPNVCKGCCCWFSLNSATFHSSEVCRHRVHGRGSAGVGYVLCIDSSTCQIVHAAKFVASAEGRAFIYTPLERVWVYVAVCVTFPCGVSIIPPPPLLLLWCSLLLFEVSAAAGCLAVCFCDSGASKP